MRHEIVSAIGGPRRQGELGRNRAPAANADDLGAGQGFCDPPNQARQAPQALTSRKRAGPLRWPRYPCTVHGLEPSYHLRVLQAALVYVNTLMVQDVLAGDEWATALT